MEDGIANTGGFMVINSTDNTLDKTWQEIYDAMHAGKLCVVKDDSGTPEGGIKVSIVTYVLIDGGSYLADTYTASSATGYPEMIAPK